MACPVFDHEVIERDAANEVLGADACGELVFSFVVTEDQMSQTTFVEAISHQNNAGMNSFIPEIEKLLVLQAYGVSIHSAVQDCVARGKLLVEIFLQQRRIGVIVVQSIAVSDGIA